MSLKQDFFIRLQDKDPDVCYNILEFLHNSNLTDTYEKDKYKNTVAKGKLLYSYISKVESRVQMVAYEWTLLPSEYMKLIIITDQDHKEFEYVG